MATPGKKPFLIASARGVRHELPTAELSCQLTALAIGIADYLPDQQWLRRSSVTRSPDTLSPLWPDRPIRPMPKNRLSSKLSPEQADSIVYPPHPPQTSPLFSFPHSIPDSQEGRGGPRANGHRSSSAHCDCGGHSDDEDAGYDHPSYRWSSPGADGTPMSSAQQKMVAARATNKIPAAPASTTSSADGYESFENTSNKKKRKIPLSSGSSAHQSSLSADMANMGISSPPPSDPYGNEAGAGAHTNAAGQYAAGAAGANVAGRTRNSRQGPRSERRGASNPAMVNGYSSSLSATSRGGDYRGDGTRPCKDMLTSGNKPYLITYSARRGKRCRTAPSHTARRQGEQHACSQRKGKHA